MRTFKVELDTAYADKAIKETGLLQGNQNFAFEFRLAERGKPIAGKTIQIDSKTGAITIK